MNCSPSHRIVRCLNLHIKISRSNSTKVIQRFPENSCALVTFSQYICTYTYLSEYALSLSFIIFFVKCNYKLWTNKSLKMYNINKNMKKIASKMQKRRERKKAVRYSQIWTEQSLYSMLYVFFVLNRQVIANSTSKSVTPKPFM